MTPEILAALERITIVLVAALFAILGYRLYMNGLKSGPTKLHAKSAWGEFAMSGTGPGLLFMGFGGIVLIYALSTSGIRYKKTETVPATTSETSASSPGKIVAIEFASSAAAEAQQPPIPPQMPASQ